MNITNFKGYTRQRERFAFLKGLLEFRQPRTRYWDWKLQDAYERGRCIMRRMTFRPIEEQS